MADYGFKVVQQGKNINSQEPRDFIFHSKFGSVKIVQEPSNKVPLVTSVNGPALTTKTVTIPHNLGFPPLCMIFVEMNYNSGKWYCGWALPGSDDTANIYLLPSGGGTKVDNNNLYLVFQNNTGSTQNIRYYYYIFGDNGLL